MNEKYLSLIEPENLIEHIQDFNEWLDLAESKKDLVDTLIAFEATEMYEYCVLIKNKIDNYL